MSDSLPIALAIDKAQWSTLKAELLKKLDYTPPESMRWRVDLLLERAASFGFEAGVHAQKLAEEALRSKTTTKET